MSIICVKNVPLKCSMSKLVTQLTRFIRGQFDALNFVKGKKTKQVFFRLSEKLDPLVVIERINNAKQKGLPNYTACIPDHIPNFPLASRSQEMKLKALSAPQPQDQTLAQAHREILVELQSKYTGLYDLSAKNDHKLLQEIGKTVYERLKHIIDTNTMNTNTPFMLSKAYRKSYPHFGDFQLILSTLHAMEDAAGAARTQVQESELISPLKDYPVIGDIPFQKVEKICQKYANKIEQKIVDHVSSLSSDPRSETPTPEELATCRVRKEFKKILPYMGHMLRQVVTASFVSPTPGPNRYIRMRIYGEPFLPTRDFMGPVLQKASAFRIIRSDFISNMVRFIVPQRCFSTIMAVDGTEVGGAKLIVRKSDAPYFVVPPQKCKGLATNEADGDDGDGFEDDMPEPDLNDEEMEDWGEEL